MVNSDNSTILSEDNSRELQVVGYDYIWIDWNLWLDELELINTIDLEGI